VPAVAFAATDDDNDNIVNETLGGTKTVQLHKDAKAKLGTAAKRAKKERNEKVKAKRRKRARVLAKRQATAPTAATAPAQASGGSTAPGHLESIAACESGGDPSAVGGGGAYRGKYQFDQSTWASVGGSGDPAAAPEAEQDQRAATLYQRTGGAAWPNC